MPVPRHLRLRTFPASDHAFADEVRRVLAAEAETVRDEETLREATIAGLRRWYRSVAIVVQDDVARMDPDTRLWYVYRDGKLRRLNPELERLYGALDSARRIERESDLILNDAAATARSAGYQEQSEDSGGGDEQPPGKPAYAGEPA
jgi:hypothetical protein